MPRSPPRPRPPPPPPRTPPPVPAPSQAMSAPAAAGEGGGEGPEQEQEFDICNDEGFVYKVPSGLYPDAAPSSTQASAAAGPDPEISGLRRRRRALLRLRAKRLRQLSRWDALASELLAPLPAPRPPASPDSQHLDAGTGTATAASASVLDDLIVQADVQAELLKKASQLCDEINALCDAHEAAIVDGIAALPVWGNPRELLFSLHSPDPDEHADPGTSGLDEGDGGFQSLDSQRGKRVASAGLERVKIIGDKRIQSPSPCKSCFQFGCTGETCLKTCGELGDELHPPVLTEKRKRKGAISPSSSSVPAQASQKRQKADGNTSMPSGSPPGTITRSKAASIPRGSPGPTTRRRSAAQHVPPRS